KGQRAKERSKEEGSRAIPTDLAMVRIQWAQSPLRPLSSTLPFALCPLPFALCPCRGSPMLTRRHFLTNSVLATAAGTIGSSPLVRAWQQPQQPPAQPQ